MWNVECDCGMCVGVGKDCTQCERGRLYQYLRGGGGGGAGYKGCSGMQRGRQEAWSRLFCGSRNAVLSAC